MYIEFADRSHAAFMLDCGRLNLQQAEAGFFTVAKDAAPPSETEALRLGLVQIDCRLFALPSAAEQFLAANDWNGRERLAVQD